MSDSSPWDSIRIPGSDLNVLQVSNRTAVPCYWARDSQGACLFVIELHGHHEREYRAGIQPVHGIELDLRAGPAGTQRFILALERHVDRDLFESLCETLASELERATDSSTSLAIALAHLRRWKAFLAGKSGRLSPEEVQGLFAELTFLGELLDRSGRTAPAVQSWLGPEDSHQDFIYGDTAVEIKSLSGTERSTVRISSEDQLESQQGNLFLRLYRLSDLADAPRAKSLNDKVAEIQQRLDDADAIETFERLLGAHRYTPVPAYDQPRFAVSDTRTFRVKDGFPRLVRSGLPGGLARVCYDLKLESIGPYECDGSAVFPEA
jgi:hypothetical protein